AAGGRRRAALEFSSLVTFQGGGLTAAEYTEFALDAVEWLLADDLHDRASHHLQEVGQRVASGSVPEALLERLRRLQVRCMDALCAYAETLRAIEEALPHA